MSEPRHRATASRDSQAAGPSPSSSSPSPPPPPPPVAEQSNECAVCRDAFGLLRQRRAACAACRAVVCTACSADRFPLDQAGEAAEARVCDPCSERLRAAYARRWIGELRRGEGGARVCEAPASRRALLAAVRLWIRAPLALPAALLVLFLGGHLSLLSLVKLSLLTVGGLAAASGRYGASQRLLFWQGVALLHLLTAPLFWLVAGAALAAAAGVRPPPAGQPMPRSLGGLAALLPRSLPQGALGRALSSAWRWCRAGELEYGDLVVEVGGGGGPVYVPVEVVHRSAVRVVLSPADGDGAALPFPVDLEWVGGPRAVSDRRRELGRGLASRVVSSALSSRPAPSPLSADGYEGGAPAETSGEVPGGPSLAVLRPSTSSVMSSLLRRAPSRVRLRVYGRALVDVFGGGNGNAQSQS